MHRSTDTCASVDPCAKRTHCASTRPGGVRLGDDVATCDEIDRAQATWRPQSLPPPSHQLGRRQ